MIKDSSPGKRHHLPLLFSLLYVPLSTDTVNGNNVVLTGQATAETEVEKCSLCDFVTVNLLF